MYIFIKWLEEIIGVVLMAIIILIVYFFVMDKANESHKKDTSTSIVVKNQSKTDTITCYLTLGKRKGFQSDVNGIFGIESSDKLQGSFVLNPLDSVVYNNDKSIPIQGNITFDYKPVNCGLEVNLFEFCLNNEGTTRNAQETVDISCVSGVNVYGSILLKGGGKWTDNQGHNDIKSIHNQSKYNNTAVSGVFPYGCPYCVTNAGRPKCVKEPATPNQVNLCQVQRNAKNSGGSVTINYIGAVNNE